MVLVASSTFFVALQAKVAELLLPKSLWKKDFLGCAAIVKEVVVELSERESDGVSMVSLVSDLVVEGDGDVILAVVPLLLSRVLDES